MSTTYDLLYRGGVSKENDIRYLTANTPPADDNSNKVPTTEWVQEKLDDTVGGGMFPIIRAATPTGHPCYAPSGGTWWCYGTNSAGDVANNSVSGGAQISSTVNGWQTMCIKIA